MAPFNKIRFILINFPIYLDQKVSSQNILNLNNPFLITFEQSGFALNFKPFKGSVERE